MSEKVPQSFIEILGQPYNIYGMFIVGMFAIFLFLLYKAQKAQKLNWLDMITNDGTKVSTTKILQLVGGVVGTWIMIKVTLQGSLTWDLFAIYLGYVASVDGFSKLIAAKYGATQNNRYQNFDQAPQNNQQNGSTKTPEE